MEQDNAKEREFKTMQILGQDHELISDIAHRSKLKHYQVVHLILEEWMTLERELRLKRPTLKLTQLKEKIKQIKREAVHPPQDRPQ